jgi:hypothetical protein
MQVLVLIGGLLLAAVVWMMLTFHGAKQSTAEPDVLMPFAVLPITDGSASTSAFLARFAGQAAWMDSSVLRSVLLVYQDTDIAAEQLCRNMEQQYDFFTALSLTQAKCLLTERMRTGAASGAEKSG